MGLSDLARFVQFGCALSLFGTAAWQLVRARCGPVPGGLGQSRRWSLAIYAGACLLGASGTIGWLFLQAKAFGGAWTAIGVVIASTRFGQVALLRAILLMTAALVAWGLRRSRALWGILGLLTAAAVVSFVWTGHGTAGVGAGSGLHAVADALHLFCAALWIGALIMLSAAAVQAVAANTLQSSEMLLLGLSQFSVIGPWLIGLLVATGIINTWLLVGPGRWGVLLRLPYGWALIAKLALFAVMLALGWRHRYRSSPALRRALCSAQSGGISLAPLRKTLLSETVLALLVLAIVAVLGNLEPPASLS